MISETGNAPAKVIKEFRKKSDRPVLKGAYIEESVYVGDDQLDTLVNIKSKEEIPLIMENISRIANKNDVRIEQVMPDTGNEEEILDLLKKPVPGSRMARIVWDREERLQNRT